MCPIRSAARIMRALRQRRDFFAARSAAGALGAVEGPREPASIQPTRFTGIVRACAEGLWALPGMGSGAGFKPP